MGWSCLRTPTQLQPMAYRYGLRLLKEQKKKFLGWTEKDKLFPIRFAYLLDLAFQNFVSDLLKFVNERRPIRSAKRAGLRGSMQRGIDSALGGFRHGSVPNLVLPAVLTSQGHADSLDDTGGGKPSAIETTEKTTETNPTETNPTWWTTNPGVVKEWKLPSGKQYGNFFNPRDEKLRENTNEWPAFQHHKYSGRHRPMCVKFQSTGKCKSSCALSHVKPDKINRKTRDEITVRFQAIYSGQA